MGGKDDDKDRESSGGFPNSIWRQMEEGHKQFLRDLEKVPKSPQDRMQSSSNIFVEFKDFIDSNLNSLAENLTSLPNNIAELRARMQEQREAHKEEQLAIWRRWVGDIGMTPDHAAIQRERMTKEERSEADAATLSLLKENKERNKHVPVEKINALYRRDNAYVTDLNGSWTHLGTSSWTPWLSIEWFKRSSYSPIALESNQLLSGDGSKWRAAFEDLLDASLDKPMESREHAGTRWPYRSAVSTYRGPGIDWMLSLICRGILPLQFPVQSKTIAAPRSGREEHACFSVPHDFGNVYDAVATPSAPMFAHRMEARQPETEEDMYRELSKVFELGGDKAASRGQGQAEVTPPQDVSVQQQQSTQSNLRCATPQADVDKVQADEWFRNQRREDSKDDLYEAFESGDVRNLQALLRTGGLESGIDDLVEEICNDEYLGYMPKHWCELWVKATGEKPSLNLGAQDAIDMDKQVSRDIAAWEAGSKQEKEALGADRKERLTQESEALGLLPQADLKTVAEPKQNKKVNVLSSLTTTQTTRMPDGTITTKVVLKQRFADGREEVEEKVHTYQEPQQQVPSSEEKPKKGGWFWT